MIEETDTTVVLDSRKVRLGFESDAFDPLRIDPESDEESSNRRLIQLLKVRSEGGYQSAEFDFKVNLEKKLLDMLAGDPVIVHLFKGLTMEASLRFHIWQFQAVMEGVTDNYWEEIVKQQKQVKGAEEKAAKFKRETKKIREEGEDSGQESESEQHSDEQSESQVPDEPSASGDGYGEEDNSGSGSGDDRYYNEAENET